MVLTELPTKTLFRPLQPLKADSPILVTEFGISILLKPIHPEKAYFPILLTELPISILIKFVHPAYLQLIVCQLVSIKTVEK